MIEWFKSFLNSVVSLVKKNVVITPNNGPGAIVGESGQNIRFKKRFFFLWKIC